ncbi:DNA binding domain protein, excisionase family [Cellulomonas flavigena DSM 20109]|uniref:DNA binding domain protein, excisionase family n=1 Tax=Cellulomonas flavigena (strain ATCC 482 / DSM 20109 / BCRC 11376 / JCM 18109 / NBRC 3775 / NCIMB 8073 / NRS 134) TaxID=446466 RepID=D5UBZ4_CELFN|nr:helix-turn-helix domain-containing protein [Cellulomonas flavigena]ADG76153.1 DNA binding domain protein, excisionase family [Cellulomonas flavigena DSM 20109]
MATTVAARQDVLTDPRDAELARHVLASLADPRAVLSVTLNDETVPVPGSIHALLREVLRAVASASTITITTTPPEVTTSTAAAILGISRPTLMKLIRNGDIPAHKVGTHTRLRTDDVLVAKRARRERERAAYRELLALEGDEE